MRSYLTRIFAVATVLMIGAFATTGCRTIQGAGADISNVGETMEDAVD
jgi:predicted small secreted protein